MTEIPTFNYRTVYFFWLSLFGFLFVLSLMDLIKVKYPEAILIVSFFNIVISVITWIYLMNLEDNFETYKIEHASSRSDLIDNLKWYKTKKVEALLGTSLIIYIGTLIALVIQLK